MRKAIIGALTATTVTFSGAGLVHATTPAGASNAPPLPQMLGAAAAGPSPATTNPRS